MNGRRRPEDRAGSAATLVALALLTPAWLGVGVPAAAQSLAFTFDDGPTLHATPLMSPQERNDAIIEHLRSRSVQAMFFVTVQNGTDRPEGVALLEQLSATGHIVGNHTVTHPDFNAETTTLHAFQREILACDEVIRRTRGYRKFIRFPFLREGADTAKRDGIRAFLRDQGYRTGHVSIDTSDWLLDGTLKQALERNPALDSSPWRDLYIANVWDHAQAYERLARQLYGREISHVVLLHHNLLAALFLGDLLDHFRARGWRIVSPDEAFSDPAYQVAPMLPRLEGSVLETTAQALGVPLRPALSGVRTERRVREEADELAASER